jgi:hypothetical protein
MTNSDDYTITKGIKGTEGKPIIIDLYKPIQSAVIQLNGLEYKPLSINNTSDTDHINNNFAI